MATLREVANGRLAPTSHVWLAGEAPMSAHCSRDSQAQTHSRRGDLVPRSKRLLISWLQSPSAVTTHRHTIKIQQKRRWGGHGTNGLDFNRPKGRSWDPPGTKRRNKPPESLWGPHSGSFEASHLRGRFPDRLLVLAGLRLRRKTLISLPCSLFLRFCEFLSPSQWQEFTPHQTS